MKTSQPSGPSTRLLAQQNPVLASPGPARITNLKDGDDIGDDEVRCRARGAAIEVSRGAGREPSGG